MGSLLTPRSFRLKNRKIKKEKKNIFFRVFATLLVLYLKLWLVLGVGVVWLLG